MISFFRGRAKALKQRGKTVRIKDPMAWFTLNLRLFVALAERRIYQRGWGGVSGGGGGGVTSDKGPHSLHLLPQPPFLLLIQSLSSNYLVFFCLFKQQVKIISDKYIYAHVYFSKTWPITLMFENEAAAAASFCFPQVFTGIFSSNEVRRKKHDEKRKWQNKAVDTKVEDLHLKILSG